MSASSGTIPMSYHILYSCGPAQIVAAVGVPLLLLTSTIAATKFVANRILHGAPGANCEDIFHYSAEEYADFSEHSPASCGSKKYFYEHYNGFNYEKCGHQCSHHYNDSRLIYINGNMNLSFLMLIHCVPVVGGVIGAYTFRKMTD